MATEGKIKHYNVLNLINSNITPYYLTLFHKQEVLF